MKINQAELTNYRNHKHILLDFPENITLIIGQNGSGKTNIMEALNLIATGKPFRAEFDQDAINHNASKTTVKAAITGKGETKIGISIERSLRIPNGATKTIKINGKSARVRALAEITNTVLFSPLDMGLLANGPSDRRRFIDNILSQSDRKYNKLNSEYTKARRQRNKVLETIRETSQGYMQLKYWNDKILEAGHYIQNERKKLFKHLNDNINNKIEQIEPNLRAKIQYIENQITPERLTEYQPKEIAACTTLIGPHRDDFAFVTDYKGKELNMGRFFSRGQQRTLIVSLKMCELKFLGYSLGEKPVLLLDDVFSELDKNHRSAMEEIVQDQQTILTATEIPAGLKNINTIFLN